MLGANDAAFTPAARDHGGVTRLASGSSQNSLRDVHAANVFWAGLVPHEDHFFATRRPGLRILGSEDSFTDRCAWDCVDALDDLARRQFGAIHSRVNHGIEKS